MSFLPGQRELRQLGSSALHWLRAQPVDAATVAAGALLAVALYFVDDGTQSVACDDAAPPAAVSVSQSEMRRTHIDARAALQSSITSVGPQPTGGFEARRLLRQAQAGSSKASKSTASSDGWGYFVGDAPPGSSNMPPVQRSTGASSAAAFAVSAARLEGGASDSTPGTAATELPASTQPTTSQLPMDLPISAPPRPPTSHVQGSVGDSVPTLQLPDLGESCTASRSLSTVSDATRLGSRVSSMDGAMASSGMGMTSPFSAAGSGVAPGTPVVIGLLPSAQNFAASTTPSALEL